MFPRPDHFRTRFISILFWAVIALCIVVLIGWQLDIAVFKTIFPNYITMKANTAISGICLSIAGILHVHTKKKTNSSLLIGFFCSIVFLLGALTLVEYLTSTQFGIDELFFKDYDRTQGSFPPGRLAPITAVCLIFLSASIACIALAKNAYYKLSQTFCFVTILISIQALTGYLFGISYAFGSAYYTQVDIHTCIAFLFLSAAILLLQFNQGFMSLILAKERVAQAIYEREARLQAIIDSALDALVTIDENGIITDWNPRAEEIFGWLKTETIGRDFLNLIFPPSYLVANVRIKKHFQNTKDGKAVVRTIETESTRRNSELFPIQISFSPIKINNSCSYIAFIADISNRKNAERLAEEHRDHLSKIIATQYEIAMVGLDLEKLMNLIVIRTAELTRSPGSVIELVSGDDLIYKAATGTAAAFIGTRLKISDSFSGLCIRQKRTLVCHDAEIDPRANAAACKKIGVRSMIVVPLRHKDEVIGVLKAYSPLARSFNDNQINSLELIAGILGAAMSHATAFFEKQVAIDSLKLTEKNLLMAQDALTKAMNAKSEFLANMSHEIRTPLNGIIGMADLLADTPLEVGQKKYIRIIQDSGAGLLTVINDILDFSKIEAGKLDLEFIDFDLVSLIEGQAELLAPRSKEKGLSLMTYIDPALPTSLNGDPGRLAQILLNLVGNAIKFTSKGSVNIRVSQEAKLSNQNFILKFSIEDTGIGLSEATQAQLFQPFTQADGSTARKFGGTGLGLSICKRLAELMGGEIGVKSTVEQGSIFWFTTVLTLGKTQRLPHKLLHQNLLCPQILIVDDDVASAEILEQYTKNWQFKASIAGDGKSALKILKENAINGSPFDIAIIDKRMPEMDGFELAEKIKADPQLKNTKIILATAFDRATQLKGALEAGFSAYLTKPVKQSELFNSIVNVLQKSDATTASIHEPEPHSSETQATKEISRSKKILVAEDNAVNQLLTLTLLKKLGYNAQAVANGKEVLDIFSRGGYDLILMDCQMPEMDGFEATQKIREMEKQLGLRVPIIALTANAMKEDEERCIRSGMDGYISKPVKKEKLGKILELWLGSTQKAS